jgi:nicotinate-nucleotide adenylyltransferase
MPILTPVRRGILGGTFDPPHFGHLFMGEVAYWQLGLDVVTFMPAGSPWQKNDRAVSDPRRRLDMTRLAIAGVPYFEADAREVDRDGWTFTADTLHTFPVHEEIVVILGADAASRLSTWERHEEVSERAEIAVMPRPGHTRQQVSATLGPDGFVWLDGPELDISGTVIRRRLESRKSVRFLMPESVRAYADAVGLHRVDAT